MTIEVRIPKLGMSMETATLLEWCVEDGAQVSAGMPLYMVETDKSTTEVEAPADGQIEIIGLVDTEYEVGTLIARIS